jgi:hypothetical protein
MLGGCKKKVYSKRERLTAVGTAGTSAVSTSIHDECMFLVCFLLNGEVGECWFGKKKRGEVKK